MEQKIRRDKNMGDNLKRLRDEHHISQEKLCAELQRRDCDIGRFTYAEYESGKLNIGASVLIELKNICGCSYDDFFKGWIVPELNSCFLLTEIVPTKNAGVALLKPSPHPVYPI